MQRKQTNKQHIFKSQRKMRYFIQLKQKTEGFGHKQQKDKTRQIPNYNLGIIRTTENKTKQDTRPLPSKEGGDFLIAQPDFLATSLHISMTRAFLTVNVLHHD